MKEEVFRILTLLENECKLKVTDDVWIRIENIFRSFLLPEQVYGEDRPPSEADFYEFKENVLVNLRNVNEVLKKLVDLKKSYESTPEACFGSYELKQEPLVWALVLCGEHSEPNLWTSAESCSQAGHCVDTLCHLCECSNLAQLLTGTTSKTSRIFKLALSLLRPKLLKETWQHYPGAVSAYKWMLKNVYSPDLSEYLYMVLPTALMIVDNHVIERRLIGLSCIDHIINNVARSELCQQGLHNVVYKTLEHLLLLNDAELTPPTIAGLTKLLQMTERGYTRSTKPGMWDRFDDTLQEILQKMLLEDRIVLRKSYINSLGPFILAMGPSVIRWTKVLLGVLDEYLNKESFDTRFSALKVLQIFLDLSSPRLYQNGNQILFLLLRTLYDVSSDENSNELEQSSMLNAIEECLLILKTATSEEASSIKNEIASIECNSIMRNVLNRVFQLN